MERGRLRAEDAGARNRRPAVFRGRRFAAAGDYSQIADELSNQYNVGCVSRNPKRDGAWRRIIVRITKPNVTARAKAGYFGPKDKR